jgi:thiamine kinase-like enzyme
MCTAPGIAADILAVGKDAEGEFYAVRAGAPFQAASQQDYVALATCYRKLWACPSDNEFTLDNYHAYVGTRAAAAPHIGAVQSAWFYAESVHPDTRRYVRENPRATHGDATLANAIVTDDGVRLIDFSVAPAPGDPLLDQAKLVLSVAGLDDGYTNLGSMRGQLGLLKKALPELPIELPSDYIPLWRPTLQLLAYYMATHLVRVGSREPYKEQVISELLEYVRI